MNKGKFLFPRELLTDQNLMRYRTDFYLLVYLLSRAAFKNGVETANGLLLKRGQYFKSMRQLATDLSFYEKGHLKKPSMRQLQNAINRLTDSGYISAAPIKTKMRSGTLFTVLKYAEYQRFEGVEEEAPEHIPDRNTRKRVKAKKTEHLFTHFEEESGTPLNEPETLELLHLEENETEERNTENEENTENAEQGAERKTPFSGTHRRTNAIKRTNADKELINKSALIEQPKTVTLFSLTEKYKQITKRNLTEQQIEFILSYVDEGIKPEAIDFALDKAALAEYPFSFLKRLLHDWRKKGIKTLEEAKQENKGGKNKNGKAPQYSYEGKNFGF